MKHAKMTLCLMLISVLLVSTWVPLMSPTTSNILTPDSKSEVVPSYETHDSIYITGDTDFNDTATSESWAGDGSFEDPFIIEGYEISDDETLIDIRDTRSHFEIQDCNLTYAWAAVYLINVTNGLIENCLIVDAFNGIYMGNVTGIDVDGCDISVHPTEAEYGIYMDDAIDCSIESCVIEGVTGSYAGIFGGSCEGITLFNNTVFEFDNHGIFFGGCYDMDILNNTVYWNEGGSIECGIYIVESLLADIIGNNITDNMDNGISIDSTDNVTIIENHIADNWIHGIDVTSSEYCLIQGNWIGYHGEGILEGPACGVTTYFSDYCQIIGNEFWWNALNSITLGYSDFCYVSDNYMNNSFDHGVWVYTSHNATIEDNEIYNSYGLSGGPACGIYVEQSHNASLVRNVLGHNSENGITISSSDDGELIGNTIFDSEYNGISILAGAFWTLFDNVIYDNGGPGIYLYGMSSDCLIYQNDIGWSGEFLAYDAGSDNAWNYTSIGNWYSDYDLIGTYDIIGGPSIDHHPNVSLYCGVTDPSGYELGTTGNTMTWNSTALNPWKYELLIDSEPQGSVIWDGDAIAVVVDGLGVGEYNVTLIAFHVSGHWLSNQSILTVVDTLGPTWDFAVADQYLEYGESLSYDVNATDPSGVDEYWMTGAAGFAIDSSGLITNTTFLEEGVYEITVYVDDIFGHQVDSEISIHVTDTIGPEWVTTPTDQEIDEDEAFSYQLYATDLSGIESWSVNDTAHFTMSQDGLITNATILTPGIYWLKITVSDGHLLITTYTIRIQVNTVVTDTTTTETTTDTTTDTTTGDDTPQPLDPAMVTLAIGGVGAIVVIGLIVYASRKRGG